MRVSMRASSPQPARRVGLHAYLMGWLNDLVCTEEMGVMLRPCLHQARQRPQLTLEGWGGDTAQTKGSEGEDPARSVP